MGARSMVPTLYVDDLGTHFQFRQEQQIQTATGNVAATGLEPRLSGFHPRKIHAAWFGAGGLGQATGKFTRAVIIGNVGNPLWLHTTNTISMPDYDSVAGVGQTTPNVMQQFKLTGRTGESASYS